LPVVFQAVHQLQHYPHHNHCNGCDHICQTQSQKEASSHGDFFTIDKESKSCPVCDYKFSINDIPFAEFLSTIIAAKKEDIHERKTATPFQSVFSDTSPRAPPIA